MLSANTAANCTNLHAAAVHVYSSGRCCLQLNTLDVGHVCASASASQVLANMAQQPRGALDSKQHAAAKLPEIVIDRPDVLPQPYRYLDQLLGVIVERALDQIEHNELEGVEAERKQVKQVQSTYPKILACVAHCVHCKSGSTRDLHSRAYAQL